MKKLLIFLSLILAAVCIWLAILDGKYVVERKIEIDVNAEKISALVTDFKMWPKWSPWQVLEPNAKISYGELSAGLGASYSWEGDILGSGEMKNIEIDDHFSVLQDLHFTIPQKSKSKVFWLFEKENDSTTMVTWGLRGKMPFFFRFMAKKMDSFIGMDYERGLKMLKDLAENDVVYSRIEVNGVVELDSTRYAAIITETNFNELDTIMKKSYEKIFEVINSQPEVKISGYPFALYLENNFVTGYTKVIMGVPYVGKIEPADHVIPSVRSAFKALKISHTGDYGHLGNAWAAAYMYARHMKLKKLKGESAFEVYVSDPEETMCAGDLVTEIYLPVK